MKNLRIKKYVLMEDFGEWQLANQMFQYIFLKTIEKLYFRKILFSKKYKNKIKISNYFKDLDFNFIEDEFINISTSNIKTIKETIFGFDKNIYSKIEHLHNEKIINIKGFFQSFKYIQYLNKLPNNIFVLKNIFILKDQYTEKINKKLKEIKLISKNKNLISIHLRRGDYLKYPDYHCLTPLNYYIQIIQELRKNTDNFFLIFSDDLNYIKRVFYSISDKCIFNYNEPIIDLYLQTYCTTNIICNSSFSLMASYLNENKNKKVYAPKNWFGIKGPNVNMKDLLLDNYLIL